MINLRILYRTDPRVHSCPDCNKPGTLKKSRSRNILEKIIKIISPLSTFRCKECGWRGYKSAYLFTSKSLQAIFIYLILFLVTSYLVSFILKRFIIK